jgi:hypothetical protein
MKKLQLLSTVAAAVLLTVGISSAQTSGKEDTHTAPQAASDQTKSSGTARETSDKSQAAQERNQAGKSAAEERGAKEERGTGGQERRGSNESGGRKESNDRATSGQSKDKGQAVQDETNEGRTKKNEQTGAADRMKGQHQNQTTEE